MVQLHISALKPEYLRLPKLRINIETAVFSALKELKIFNKLKNAELSIYFCDDATIKKINRETRGKNKPTNILSFPFLNVDIRKEKMPDIANEIVGEIICSIETLKNEAKEQKKKISDHLIHLFVHSALHLFGYDHMNEAEAEEMEKLEIKILKKLKIENPYIIK